MVAVLFHSHYYCLKIVHPKKIYSFYFTHAIENQLVSFCNHNIIISAGQTLKSHKNQAARKHHDPRPNFSGCGCLVGSVPVDDPDVGLQGVGVVVVLEVPVEVVLLLDELDAPFVQAGAAQVAVLLRQELLYLLLAETFLARCFLDVR